MRIGLLLFDEVDLLDVGGPYEVFLTASRLAMRDGNPPPFEVMTIGMGRAPVRSYGGMGLIPTHTFDEIDELDVVVIPGAIAIEGVLADDRILRSAEWLADRSMVTASVCTGAFVLGKLGLLDGLGWTTHFEDLEDLSKLIGSAGGTVARWVDQGDIVTAGGLSSGIAMALHLVDRLVSRQLAIRTARQLQYGWDPDPRGPSHAVVVLVWTGAGGTAALHDYERRVRPLIEEHGGTFRVILQPDTFEDWVGDPPDEIHVLSFEDPSGWSGYRSDPRRETLEDLRSRAMSRTISFSGARVPDFS